MHTLWAVPTLLLVWGVLSLVLTLHAHHPVGGKLVIAGIMGAWFVRELAVQHVFWQGLVAAVLIVQGGYAGVGVIGFWLLLASWLALLRLHFEATRATVSVRSAFRLGDLSTPRHSPTYPRSHILFPYLMLRRPGVEHEPRVKFAEVNGTALYTDIFRPTDRDSKRPALLHLHGGSWVMSFKRFQGIPLLTHLAANGWVVFNADYRLSPGVAFPEHLHDVKRAIAWIRENADTLGVDAKFIAVSGGSAGGHLATLAALTQNKTALQPGFEQADTSVQAALSFYGVYDFSSDARSRHFLERVEHVVMQVPRSGNDEHYQNASPIACVNKYAPPFFIVHGDKDTMTPVQDARRFVERLRAVSEQPVIYVEVQGANHNFDLLPSMRSVSIVEGAERFLRLSYGKTLPVATTPLPHLSGVDASFLYSESENAPMHTLKIGVLTFLTKAPTRAQLLGVVSDHLGLLPALRKVILPVPGGLFHPVWHDAQRVDVHSHVSFTTLADDTELDAAIAHVAEGMLPQGKPLWHLTIIEGLSGGRIAAVLKLHHALADGGAAAKMLRAIAKTSMRPPSPVVLPKPALAPSGLSLIASALSHRFLQIALTPALLVRTLLGARAGWKYRNPRRMLFAGARFAANGPLQRVRTFTHFDLSFARVRALGKRLDVTVNDLIYALTAGALREHQLATHGDTSKPLIASMPLALETTDHALGNRVSNGFAELPIHIADPLERLHLIQAGNQRTKDRNSARGGGTFAAWSERLLPWMQHFIWCTLAPRFKTPPINLVLANVVGPKRQRYIGSARLDEIYSVGPLVQSVGLNVTAWSYAGKLYFSVLATERLLQREQLAQRFEGALRELEATTFAGVSAPAHSGRDGRG